MFYIFCSFTLIVCGEKNVLPNLTNSQEPEPEPEPLGKTIRSRSRLKIKPGAGAVKKFAGSPALHIPSGSFWINLQTQRWFRQHNPDVAHTDGEDEEEVGPARHLRQRKHQRQQEQPVSWSNIVDKLWRKGVGFKRNFLKDLQARFSCISFECHPWQLWTF